MRRHATGAVVGLTVVALAGVATTTYAQFSPDPTPPTTTLPDGAVGTCRIEGVSPSSDVAGTIVGVDVFLRCAETTAHTSLHQLHLGADTWTVELGQLLPLIVEPPDDAVTPQ